MVPKHKGCFEGFKGDNACLHRLFCFRVLFCSGIQGVCGTSLRCRFYFSSQGSAFGVWALDVGLVRVRSQ